MGFLPSLFLATLLILVIHDPTFARVHYADSEVFTLDNVASSDPTDHPPGVAVVAAHPNPFNPRTRIHFKVDTPGQVHLAIYDLRGRLVAPLVAAELDPGPHTADWCGVDGCGRGVPSGVYFCRLVSGSATRTMKVVLLR